MSFTFSLTFDRYFSGQSEDTSSYATVMEFSESSSSVMGEEIPESTSYMDLVSLTQLEQLSHELANRGPRQSEVELR